MLHLFQKQVIFIFSNNFFSPLQKLHHSRKKANMSDETNQFSLNLGSAGQNQKRTRDEPKPDRGFLGNTFLLIHLLRINDPDDPQHIPEVKQNAYI